MSFNDGGVDVKVFVQKPKENCLCPLCFNVLKDLKSCPNGHCFCGDCATTALKRRKECPICKVHLSVESLCRNLVLDELIGELDTYCPSRNLSEGEQCQWTGNLRTCDQHYKMECEFYKVKCPEVKCFHMVQKRLLVDHIENECAERSVSCQFCHMSLSFATMKTHITSCSERLVVCPNECGQKFPMKSVFRHMENDCPFQIVKCPLFDNEVCHSSCKGKLRKCDMPSHMLGDSVENGVILQQSRKIVSLEAENELLSKRLAECEVNQLSMADALHKLQSQMTDILSRTTTAATTNAIETKSVAINTTTSLIASVKAKSLIQPLETSTTASDAVGIKYTTTAAVPTPMPALLTAPPIKSPVPISKQSIVAKTATVDSEVTTEYVTIQWNNLVNIFSTSIQYHMEDHDCSIFPMDTCDRNFDFDQYHEGCDLLLLDAMLRELHTTRTGHEDHSYVHHELLCSAFHQVKQHTSTSEGGCVTKIIQSIDAHGRQFATVFTIIRILPNWQSYKEFFQFKDARECMTNSQANNKPWMARVNQVKEFLEDKDPSLTNTMLAVIESLYFRQVKVDRIHKLSPMKALAPIKTNSPPPPSEHSITAFNVGDQVEYKNNKGKWVPSVIKNTFSDYCRVANSAGDEMGVPVSKLRLK